MKKLLVLLLCAVLLVTACGSKDQSGGGSTDSKTTVTKDSGETQSADEVVAEEGNLNTTGLPILKEKAEFEIYVPQGSTVKAANDKPIVARSIEETNVVTNFVEVAKSSWTEKVNILFSTGSLPDAFIGGVNVAEKYPQLVALDDYLTPELAPNTVEFLNSRPEYWDILKAPDGHIYGLPVGDESYWNIIDSQIWINTEWLEAVGKEMPTTIDEFYDVLVAFKDGDPNGNGDSSDEVPFTFRGVWGWGMALENAFAPFGVFESDAHVMTVDGEVSFAAKQDGYYEALKFFAKLMEEDLMDPESFTHSAEQYKAKVAANVDTYGVYIFYNTKREDAFAPLMLKDGSGEYMVGINNVEKVEGFSITTACEDPAALVRWYDYCNSSVEMMFNWNRGVEGETWEFFDGEGDYQVRPIKDQALWEANGATNLSEMRNIQAFAGNSPAFMDMADFAIYDEGARPKIVHNMEVVANDYGVKSLPAGFSTQENSERRSLLLADIDSYLNQFVAVSVFEGITDEDWNKHLETLEALKVDEYVELCQEFVDGK